MIVARGICRSATANDSTKQALSLSVDSTGESYDNALAETLNRHYKAELVQKSGQRKTLEVLELETLNWVSWFNQQRLLESIENIPSAEFEALYERSWQQSPTLPDSTPKTSAIPGVNQNPS